MNRQVMTGSLATYTDKSDFYFSPDGNLAGRPLTMIVQYRRDADRDSKYDVVPVTGKTTAATDPWNNVDSGARPNTFTADAFVLSLPHDLIMTGNEAYQELSFPGETGEGRTHRFLEIGVSENVSGFSNLVAGNSVNKRPQGTNRGWIGYRTDESKVPQGSNQPEMILTESYQSFFEGTGYRLSADRQTLRISYRFGKPLRSGEIVAVLDGSGAGNWVRIAQLIDHSVVDPPMSTVLRSRSHSLRIDGSVTVGASSPSSGIGRTTRAA
ncbi:MAG: hypothetical protein WKF75_05135 [Singulisphaera sp.]